MKLPALAFGEDVGSAWAPELAQPDRVVVEARASRAQSGHPSAEWIIVGAWWRPRVARVRELLAQAEDAARELGDDAMPEPAGAGYFADAETSGITSAIEQIAAHDGPITLFVGAGVSMEAELPSRNHLVRDLLVRARDEEAPEDAVSAWADTVLTEGPLAAAAVAEALYGNELSFRQALRAALYERDPSTYVPGALAGQIAWLKVGAFFLS